MVFGKFPWPITAKNFPRFLEFIINCEFKRSEHITKDNKMIRVFSILPLGNDKIEVTLSGKKEDKDLEKCIIRLENYIREGVEVTAKRVGGQLKLLFVRK